MDEKTKSILAYVFGWIGGLIVMFAFKDNTRNTKVHAAQAITASAATAILGLLLVWVPFIPVIFWGLYLAVMIIGIIRVAQDSQPEIPGVYDVAKLIFSKLIEE